MDIVAFNRNIYRLLDARGYSGSAELPPGVPDRSGFVSSSWFLPSGNLAEPFALTIVGTRLSESYASVCSEAIVAEFALWHDSGRGAELVDGVEVRGEEPFVVVDGHVPPQSIWYERRLTDVSSERLSQYLHAIRAWRRAADEQWIALTNAR